MSPLALAVHVAAVVLAVAGVAKLIDPGAVTRSLSAAGLASAPMVGRALGAGEVTVGAWVLAVGGAASAAALAGWYVAFTIYVVVNRVRGLDVPCGCVGGVDRPAGTTHLAVDVAAGAVAIAAVARPVGDVTVWLDHGAAGVVALVAVALLAAVVVAVVLPGRIGGGTPRKPPQ